MNTLILLPLLAAACVAAPGGIFRSDLINGGFVQTGLPVGGAITYSAVQPVVQQVQVQVPVTKTVHYETKPVVTGYSTSIIKPAIATGFAAAPVAVQGELRQLPPLPSFPGFPPTNGTADAPAFPSLPGADSPQFPALPSFPSFPSAPTTPAPTTPPPGGENTNETGGSSYQQFQTLPVQQSYDFVPYLSNPHNLLSVAQHTFVQPQPAQVAVAQDAVVVEARSAPIAAPIAVAPAPIQVAQPVVALRAAQAGDFGPLVTQEKVLAPVRSHTQITPQVTQIQPEVSVRKVIHDVPVAQPIAVQTPVTYAVHNPVVAHPQAIAYSSNVFAGQQILNGQLFNGQQIVL
jgi:hypothetical protein